MGDFKYEMDEYGNVRAVGGGESGGSVEEKIAALKEQLSKPPAAGSYGAVKKSLSTVQAGSRSIDDAADLRRIMSNIPIPSDKPVLANSGAVNNKKIPFATWFAVSCPLFILFMLAEESLLDNNLLIRSYGAGTMVTVSVVCSLLFSLFIFFFQKRE